MEKLKEKIAKRLEKRINNPDEALIQNISESVDRAFSYFKIYCNRQDVPDEAEFLIYDMCLLQMKQEGFLQSNSDVKEISRGDTKIVYTDKKSVNESVFEDFHSRLIRFRKLGLVKKETL